MKLIENQTEINVKKLAHLFDAYRVFYGKSSNVQLAENFLNERIENNQSHIIVAVNDQEKYVGFTQIYPVFSSVSCQKDFILNDLYVLNDYRKTGVATLLLEKAKVYVNLNDGKGLALETASDNPAKILYESLGWHEDKSYLHYYWNANNNPKVIQKFVNDSKKMGVFSNTTINKGEIILVGKSVYKTKTRDHKTLQIEVDCHSRLDTPFENTNHSCSPNAGVVNNEFEGYNLIALHDIESGAEITMDYCMTEWESNLGDCACQSENCRKKIDGARYLQKEILDSYNGYIADYLKVLI